ncbi:Similar to mms19: MMS19 nucleotide excision repair protein homolog (Xenopus laevis) [Cotesia congregata]|uniref:MMS19 nucleotide excision repair protein n=1 Tax=Cotesia congregata TaxID=51543 RepID=A0A8J2ECS9_COTCN|nr:Similar to mms19: MMS19 nucleotide excision repair protein homolog (Xenopus laevis) [Cotesia congregata]
MTPTKTYDFVEKLRTIFDNDCEKSKLNKLCIDIVNDIENGQIKLFQIIEQLGVFLTNADVNIRENGIKTLSLILDNIDKNYLNEQEVELLSTFYCERFKDHHSIIPVVVQGILSIIKMKNLPKSCLPKIFHGLYNDLRCQSELQATRRNIFFILKIALSRDLEDLKKMGPDFIYGVISSMDGESDPRNLMILFDTLPTFLREFSLGHLTEEMFEVLACYFPVDFNSAGKDAQEITREDLAHGLENCLIQVPEFGEFVLPLILEKLDSNLKTARLDALNLLIRGSKIYKSKALTKHVDELWPLIRRDVLPGNDNELKLKNYDVITQITQVLSDDKINFEKFISRVIVDLKSSLGDVQLSLYWPSIKVLETIAQAHVDAAIYVLKLIVPLCLGQYGTKTTINDKIHLIETMNIFLHTLDNLGMRISDIPELTWADIPGLYLNELITEEIILKSKLIDGLAMQKLSLSENQRDLIYEKISSEIDKNQSENLITSCYNIIKTLAKLYPNEILELVDNKLKVNDEESLEVRKNRLRALAEISTISNIGKTILPILVQIAVSIDNDMINMSLYCIHKILLMNNCEFDIHIFLYKHCDIVLQLLETKLNGYHDRKIISSILRLIVQKLSAEEQRELINKYFDRLSENIKNNIERLEGILIPLMPCIINSNDNRFIDLIKSLIEVSTKNLDENIQLSCCKIVSTLVNKIDKEHCLEKLLNFIRELIVEILESDNYSLMTKKSAVVLNIWITKALVTRGSKAAQDFIDYQLNILKNHSVGKYAANHFRILVDSSDDTLHVDNYCIIKLFYKQRIFQNVIQQNSLFDGESRQNYLIAFIFLLEEIPRDILLMHLSKVLPLLIESLSLDNKEVILFTLKILKDLLDTKNMAFIEQIQSFITTCLKLTTYPDMNIKIAAHNCLHRVVKRGGYTYEDGTKYYGDWNARGLKHGAGSMVLPDGTRYEGGFQNGLCSGLGVLIFPDGAKYEGEFMQGWFHGHGVFWRSDGMKFEGEFRGGRIWGLGLVTYSDGTHGFPRNEGFFQDCRLVRRRRCPEVILKAQKISMIARAQAS